MAKYEIKDGVGIIPEGTKEIEVDAFAGCTELISVTIPETVTSIGDGAFWCCDNLTEIVIPASVNQIGHSLFGGCEKLKSVVVKEGNNTYDSREQCNAIIETSTGRLVAGCMTSVIPQSVKEIGFAAFRNCTTLQEIHIPDGVTAIGEYAFISCQALTSIVLPEGITEIKECTFQECTNLEEVGIPDTVTKIGECAFYKCAKLSNLVLPKALEEMGKAALAATNLTKIEVPESLTVIPPYAFSVTHITSIAIPASVTEIGDKAFKGCRRLESIQVPNGKEDFYKAMLPEELHELINKKVADKSEEQVPLAESIEKTCTEIKDYLSSIGKNKFTIYTSDFSDKLDEDKVEDLDNAENVSLLNSYGSVGGYWAIYAVVRRVKVKKNVLLFDVEEYYSTIDGGNMNMEPELYKDLSISDLIRNCGEEGVKECVEGLCDYIQDEYIVALNK